MTSAADLASVSSTLTQLLERVSEAADSLVGSNDEDLMLGLMEVERSLRTGSRRLERLVKEMRTR